MLVQIFQKDVKVDCGKPYDICKFKCTCEICAQVVTVLEHNYFFFLCSFCESLLNVL